MKDQTVIAVDGPAGAGKSTVSRALARRLEYVYIDTGAMYRAITLLAIRHGVDPHDEVRLEALARESDIIFRFDESHPDEPNRIFLDGEDVSDAIRTPQVSALVSPVSAVPGVRTILTHRQRELACTGRVVMDGRDIGTTVLPAAGLKIFLTASLEERARRRFAEMQKKGFSADFAEVKKNLAERDAYDSGRKTSPLAQADDAVLLDTTCMSIDEVVDALARLHGGG